MGILILRLFENWNFMVCRGLKRIPMVNTLSILWSSNSMWMLIKSNLKYVELIELQNNTLTTQFKQNESPKFAFPCTIENDTLKYDITARQASVVAFQVLAAQTVTSMAGLWYLKNLKRTTSHDLVLVSNISLESKDTVYFIYHGLNHFYGRLTIILVVFLSCYTWMLKRIDDTKHLLSSPTVLISWFSHLMLTGRLHKN